MALVQQPHDDDPHRQQHGSEEQQRQQQHGLPDSPSHLEGIGSHSSLPLPTPLRVLDAAALASVQRAYPHLTELNLDGNELHDSAISPLLATFLPSLRSLRLSCNLLTQIPDFGALPHLTSLDLHGNRIAHVQRLAACSRLESLDLSGNQIEQLPSLCAEIIMECPNLTSLQLHSNPLPAHAYRVALLSLLPALRALDGVMVRPEEHAYLQLLAATQLNESGEGQRPQFQEQLHEPPDAPMPHASHFAPSAPADIPSGSQWSSSVAPMALPLRHSHVASDLHVQDVDDESGSRRSDDSSPLHISPGPSDHDSMTSTPRSVAPGAQPSQQAQQGTYAAIDRAAAAELRQRQEHKQQEWESEQLRSPAHAEAHALNADRHSEAVPPAAVPADVRTYGRDVARSVTHSPVLDSRADLPQPVQPVQPVQSEPQPQPQPHVEAAPQNHQQYQHHQSHHQQQRPQQQWQQQQQSQQPPPPSQRSPLQPPPSQQPLLQHAPPASQAPVDVRAWDSTASSVGADPRGPALPLFPQQPWPVEAAFAYQSQPYPVAATPLRSAHPSQLMSAPSAPLSHPSAPIVAPSEALVSALSEKTQQVQSLQQELQQMKDSLAREQAHVRTVKAYYKVEPQAAPVAAPPSSFTHATSLAPLSLPLIPPAAAAVDSPSSSSMLSTYRAEIAHLRKQNELLQIQQDTTAEILRMKDRQSEEVRAKAAQSRARAGQGRPEPDLSILWRDKVFALLVQNKTLLLTHAEDIKGYKETIASRSQQVQQLEQQLLLASKSAANLQAQVDLFQHDKSHRQHQQEQTHLLQSEVQRAAARLERDRSNVRHLLEVFATQVCAMEEKTHKKLNGRLDAFNRRMGFAQQRVEVVRAIKSKGRGSGAGSARGPMPLLPLPESKREEVEVWAEEDIDAQHLRKEIQRLHSDRSLLYSSWQREVASLRADLYASSSRLSNVEAGAQALHVQLDQLRVENEYLSKQNSELRREAGAKVSKEALQLAESEHVRREEALSEELSALRSQFIALKSSEEQLHKSSLRMQIELNQTKSALAQAKTDSAELNQAKYEYLEEKLRRKEAQVEELQAEKRKLQQQVRDMDQQIILLKYGVNPDGVGGGQQQQAQQQATMPPQFTAAPAHAPSMLPPAAVPSSSVPPAARSASANSFSNLLFGNVALHPPRMPQGSLANSAGASYVAHARPPPMPVPHSPQPHYSSYSAPPQRQSAPASSASLLHDHPIPASFGQAAAALEQGLSSSRGASLAPSAASSRMHSQPPSVAPSPMRTRTSDVQPASHSSSTSRPVPVAAAAPVVPPLRFPPSSLGVSTPPLAAAAAPSHTTASRPASANVARKISHLAALSARLLDDEE